MCGDAHPGVGQPMNALARRLRTALCLVVMSIPAHAPAAGIDQDVRVLFVGNSLTYVGNLPAVLQALGAANDKRVSTEMLVSGGATLADRLDDSSLQRLLDARRFDYVVLQERGGDVLCVRDVGPRAPCDSYRAHVALGKIIRSHNAMPVVLGTYQRLEPVSRATEASEAVLARRIGALHVRVSERLRRASARYGTLDWYDADGSHPGPDLVLLEAVGLYSAILGAPPAAHELHVARPFDPGTYFSATSVASSQSPLTAVAPRTYDAHRVARIVAIAAADRP